MRYHLRESELPSSKILQRINAGEAVEKREPSCTVGGNANRYSHMDNSMDIPLKVGTDYYVIHHPITGHRPRENRNSKRHVYPQSSLQQYFR